MIPFDQMLDSVGGEQGVKDCLAVGNDAPFKLVLTAARREITYLKAKLARQARHSLVYHNINPTFGFPILPDQSIRFPDDFEAAVEVDSDDVDKIFELTNLWPKDKRLHRLLDRCRSTSVGDIIETPDHHLYLCMPLGWKDLGVFDGNILTISNNLYKDLQNEKP